MNTDEMNLRILTIDNLLNELAAHEDLTALDVVQLMRMIEETAANGKAWAVANARMSGETWADVGRMLGTSPQAAQQRYGVALFGRGRLAD